jgi:zinc protease
VKDAKSLKAVEHAVLMEVKALAGGRVDAKRMEAVRSNLRYSNIMGLEKADSVALSLVANTALTGDTDFLNREFEALAAAKPGDLPGFAKKYMLDVNRTAVTLLPGGAQ